MEPNTAEHNQSSTYPVSVIAPRPERSSRWLALATLLFAIPKAIILIPHFIILYFLGIIIFVLAIFAQFAVLFTGVYPAGLYKIVKGTLQWQLRANAYFLGLTDKYPPFSFE